MTPLVLLPLTTDEATKVRSALSYFRTKVYPQHHRIIDGILANLDGATKDAERTVTVGPPPPPMEPHADSLGRKS